VKLLIALALLVSGCNAGMGPGDRIIKPLPGPVNVPELSKRDPCRSLSPRAARDLRATTAELHTLLAFWLDFGAPVRGVLKRRIAELAVRQQKIVRSFVAKSRPAPRLPARWARHIAAARAVRRNITPLEPPIRMRLALPAPPRTLLRYYRTAQRRFGVPWHVLASVNFVESKFGRILGPSVAGARGPMQFLPSTWSVYGRGDINDPHDSIMAAGRYLRASGAPDRMREALFAYNHSDAYVNGVLTYAADMKRNPLHYYAFYFWHVFVLTTKGDRQLTGPCRS
jgi:soluble lytic murein transglycosylase-like protein